jgi:ppGpp synthetase/RelA/SpoT-type nucleotidyltranferase
MTSPAVPQLPSKSQLKNAGDRLRKRVTGVLELDGEQAAVDALLVKRWRSAHSGALAKTRVGLGLIVMKIQGKDSQAGLVTQRLKRFESIVAKLVRDKSRLAEMEDIAGCRAVLPDVDTVTVVHQQLEGARKLDISRIRDYNILPHAGGYRALHLWCQRDGFKVEVQLRTSKQQEWAETVEEWDSGLGLDIKHDRAPDVVLTYFRELANFYCQLDSGMADSDVDTSSLGEATAAVRDWLAGEASDDRRR